MADERDPGGAGRDGERASGPSTERDASPKPRVGARRERPVDDWSDVRPLALVFGVVSVPWTYAFVAVLEIPLWPSFVASATYFAASATAVERSGSATDSGRRALLRALASNSAGIAYGAGTLAVVAAVDGGPLALSLVVGVAMSLAALHGAVPLVSFAPGGFFGYATLFSVDAAGASVLGIGGLAGVTLAAAISMGVGAPIGFGADLASEWIDDRSG